MTTTQRRLARGSFAGLLMLLAQLLFAAPPPLVVFEPNPTDGVSSFYTNGNPVAVKLSDSVSFVLALDLCDIGSKQYVRLWALVRNNSEQTFDLKPQQQFSVKALGDDFSITCNMQPQPSSLLLGRLESEMHWSQAAAMLSGVVSTIAANIDPPSNTSGGFSVVGPDLTQSSGKFQINDAGTKLEARVGGIATRTAGEVHSLGAIYESARTAVSSGILRRNTLAPGLAANGYIYFDFESVAPPIDAPKQRGWAGQVRVESAMASRQTYVVSIAIPGQPPQSVSFWPVEGE